MFRVSLAFQVEMWMFSKVYKGAGETSICFCVPTPITHLKVAHIIVWDIIENVGGKCVIVSSTPTPFLQEFRNRKTQIE